MYSFKKPAGFTLAIRLCGDKRDDTEDVNLFNLRSCLLFKLTYFILLQTHES